MTDATQVISGSAGLLCGKRAPHTQLARWLNPNPKKALLAACWVLLVLWCIWWGVSFHHQTLQAGKHLWFSPAFGVDFYYHVDFPARIWWNGEDPYANKEHFFPYPPSEMRLFAWVNLMTPRAALMVWLIVMTMIIVAAAWAASRWRRRLSLGEIPPLAAVVLILFSTPVLFALERGQYDPLSLLFILAALPLLNHQSKWAQFLAGAVLCLAPWAKVYPGLIFVGLLGLRRWRALAGFVAVGIVIAIAFLYSGEIQRFLVNNALHIQMAENLALFASGDPCPWNHSLTLMGLWFGVQPGWLGLLFGKVIAAALLLPPLVWVTYHVYRCPARDTLTYPYLLWVVALATFVPPISNDYNLCFLPLAVLAVWDRRDPLLVHVAIVLLFIWWQPVGMAIGGKPLLLVKFIGLGAIAICLVERACEQSRLVAANGERDSDYCKNHQRLVKE
jgi:hypothetical protein